MFTKQKIPATSGWYFFLWTNFMFSSKMGRSTSWTPSLQGGLVQIRNIQTPTALGHEIVFKLHGPISRAKEGNFTTNSLASQKKKHRLKLQKNFSPSKTLGIKHTVIGIKTQTKVSNTHNIFEAPIPLLRCKTCKYPPTKSFWTIKNNKLRSNSLA